MSDHRIRSVATIYPAQANTMKSDQELLPQPRLIIQEFALTTSTHGIPGIARSQSHHNRFFWAISLLAFTGIMTYFIAESIQAYFAYPTQTLVSIAEENNPLFPAVTFCNYSPLRYDRFIQPFLDYTNGLNLTNTNDTTSFSESQAGYIRDFFQYKLNRGESLEDYFYSLDSMLISCKYNSLNCSKEDFLTSISSRYGYCYTFNAKSHQIRNGTLFKSGTNGEWGNLRIDLYVHSHQAVPYFSDGMKLNVRSQTIMISSTSSYWFDCNDSRQSRNAPHPRERPVSHAGTQV